MGSTCDPCQDQLQDFKRDPLMDLISQLLALVILVFAHRKIFLQHRELHSNNSKVPRAKNPISYTTTLLEQVIRNGVFT